MHRRRRRKRVSDHAPDEHGACDWATEWLFILLIVITPWSIGPAQSWVLWLAQFMAYGTGLLWIAKLVIRKKTEFTPPRWGEPPAPKSSSRSEDEEAPPIDRPMSTATRVLAGVTVAVLGYVAFTALNARGDFDEARNEFRTFDWCLSWLPHSEDRGATLWTLAQYLALACVFWSMRDWLMQRVSKDGKEVEPAVRAPEVTESIAIPFRVRRLLWIIALNAGTVATIAILHRASRSRAVLWLFQQPPEREGTFPFGPWHNSTHAGQYFNLVWPLGLAFWLWMHERAVRSVDARRARLDGPQLVLLPVTVVVASAALISDGLGATLVACLCGIVGIILTLRLSGRVVSRFARTGLVTLLIATGVVYFSAQWQHLVEQFTLRDHRVTTEVDVGSGDFTLFGRVKIPAAPDGQLRKLITLSKELESDPRGGSLVLVGLPTGGLALSVSGVTLDDAVHLTIPNLPASASNHVVNLTIIRQDGIRIFVNGTELAGIEHQTGSGATWRNLLHSTYLAVLDPSVLEVGLANFAFNRDEIAATIRNSVQGIADSLATGPLASKDLSISTNEFRVPPDTSITLASRPSSPNNKWLVLKRTAENGGLGLHRTLADVDPRLVTASSATLKIWNPADSLMYLSGSLREGRRATVEVLPRTESTVTIPLVPGAGRGEASIDLAVTDSRGADLTNLPVGTQLYLHDLQLHSVRTIFTTKVEEQMPMAAFRDRLLGRNEVARNARRMAADHGWLGSGAGSFRSVYTRYHRPDHPMVLTGDGWSELHITLGWFGLIAAATALAALALKSLRDRGAPTIKLVLAFLWLGPASCVVHARFDVPFQSFAVALLFVITTAMVSTLSIARRA